MSIPEFKFKDLVGDEYGQDISNLQVFSNQEMEFEIDTPKWTNKLWAELFIRCKDCYFLNRLNAICPEEHGFCSRLGYIVSEDFFCADGMTEAEANRIIVEQGEETK